jgi:iron complex transport system substrate-binding protein
MRVVSHSCSNTEIVCALGCAAQLIAVDADSDYPADVVTALPKLGRDLEFDVAATRALQPDLVLSSLTVPGHERIVEQLRAAGMRTLVCDPQSLEDVYEDIRRIAGALGVAPRGERLASELRAAMPAVQTERPRPRVLLEWWPKPVIAPGRRSWATDLIARAGGANPWGDTDVKSAPLEDRQVLAAAPELIVMSWCGVKAQNYRAEIVRRRAGWEQVPAVREDRIVGISEAYLGRPGPRLVEGYRQLRRAIERLSA